MLDFAVREMEDAHILKDLPADKEVAVGVIDVRNLQVETPEQVAERIRKVLQFIEPERVDADHRLRPARPAPLLRLQQTARHGQRSADRTRRNRRRDRGLSLLSP